MGAVCDWSIPSPSKPFFSLCHVQSVDKRHHPTDSLINCEMYSYLPLSYSRGPKKPPLPASSASPFLPVCKEKKQTGLHKDSFRKKEKQTALLANFCFKIFYSFPIISTCRQPCVHMHSHTETSMNTHTQCLNTGMQGHGDKKSAHYSAAGLRLKVAQLSTLFYTHRRMSYAFLSQ